MRSIISFLFRNIFYILFVFLLCISIYLIDVKKQYTISKSRNSLDNIGNYIKDIFFSLKKIYYSSEYNTLLLEENSNLKSKIHHREYTTDQRECQYNYIGAEIISNTYKNNNNYLVLNKGYVDGIKPYMGVVTQEGVVGIINAVSKNYSRVMSILNRDIKISSGVSSNNFFGITTWNGNDYKTAQIDDIPKEASVNIGDTISTNGFSFIFPKNIPIGIIMDYSLNKKTGLYEIQISLSNDFRRIKYVYVIKNNLKEEIEKLKL
ncbi:rod shape-determining protein MreC [Ichthyobacterium seriolicida]|nr:rod shape-determining protein MreC [Ichthyobacterium seriolicida]